MGKGGLAFAYDGRFSAAAAEEDDKEATLLVPDLSFKAVPAPVEADLECKGRLLLLLLLLLAPLRFSSWAAACWMCCLLRRLSRCVISLMRRSVASTRPWSDSVEPEPEVSSTLLSRPGCCWAC